MARPTRQCPRSVHWVYDPDEEPTEPPGQPEVDWDAWARGRWKGANRWWLAWAIAMMVALTALYFSGNSDWFQP